MAEPEAQRPGLLSPQGQRLLASLPAYDPGAVLALTTRLRAEGYPQGLVAEALTQARLRARAGPKLGPLADRLYLTEDGLQQATRPEVAALHARRYLGAGVREVLDLCCGIGGDLLPMAAAGLRVTGVDRDPLTAALAAANIDVLGLGDRASVVVADATEVDLAGVEAVFVDPARRSARGRTFDPRSYSPSFDAVLAIADRVPATGAKLAPGIPHAVLPRGAEAEWVSHHGDVVECGLWSGPLAGPAPRRATLLPSAATITGDGARRATLLPSGATITGDGERRAPVGPVRRYLHEPDGAVIRASLIAEVAEPSGATLLDGSIAYLATDAPVESPFLTSYEVLDVMAFGLKPLRAALRERGVGSLNVKKRGTAVEPETLRRQLRLSGDNEATIVLTRVAGEQKVLVVRPLAATS